MHNHKYLGRLLIVDDDKQTCAFWKVALGQEGFRVDTAHTLDEMKEIVQCYSIDAILLDLNLGHENGLDALPYLMAEAPFARVFVLTANATVETAVEAMTNGATGYVSKDTPPAVIAEQLKKHLLDREIDSSQFTTKDFEKLGLIGQSKGFKDVCSQIEQLKDVDSTILILGESGTGKEVVARTLHKLSNRIKGRFEAINCAAIPENLLESELFGHKRGAFTDAKTDRKGIFELCSGGTLLLDEIGDMPLSLQTKLLRVLQERKVTPIGSSTAINIDTRVIAATHRDLVEEIQNRTFREDLYYRLSVVPIHIPPLRHRKDDIPLLVSAFIRNFNERFHRNVKAPGNDIMKRIMAYDWRGNIRELRNAIERSVVLSRDDQLSVEDLFQHLHRVGGHGKRDYSPAESLSEAPGVNEEIFDLPLTDAKHAFEKIYIERLLKKTNGNITETSKRSGRYRADIYKLLEKYSLELDTFR